ncbi:MAG: DMT family transporter [Chloroflexota bacterium]|nr:DMT family transporter [Chloroflexota bacterium]
MDRILTWVIGLIGGIAVGLQGPIVTGMSQQIGGAAGSLIVHISGALFSAVLLAARGGENIAAWTSLPWYMLVSGGFGLVLYLTLNHTLPQLGAAPALVLIIVGQLLMGMVLDHFGWLGVVQRPIDVQRVIAAALLLAGAWLMVR